MPIKDLSGLRFGRLVAISVSGKNPIKWLCRCDCGESVAALASNLSRGNTRSCGCLRREKTVERFTTHGGAGTAAHVVWLKMKRRCLSPDEPCYPDYGGRGITICERWLTFGNFLADMGQPPKSMTIDRIDVNGPYSPGNCRWLDRAAQNRNRRDNVTITARGETLCLSEWARRVGISPQTLSRRLARGWDGERILATPAWTRA